jgi:hypothetical protein
MVRRNQNRLPGSLVALVAMGGPTVDPFWLGGAITILGVALGVLGWKLIARGRSDVALEAARHNDDQVARHQAHLAGEGSDARQYGSASEHTLEKESSLRDPPDQR